MGRTLEERIQLIEDREEIKRLRIRYTLCNDGGWNGRGTHQDIDGLMELFAPDAVWDGRPVAGRAVGWEAVRRLMLEFREIPFVIHNVMNPIIDVDGDTATGNWHAIIALGGGGEAQWMFGNYIEDYVRLDGVWKFRHVRFVPAVTVPYDEGWGKYVPN